MEVVYSDEGIHLPQIDLWLDPATEKQAAWLSHAHADHAASGHREIVATPETLAIYRLRHGGDEPSVVHPLPHGQRLEWNGGWLTSISASHILGSAQLLVECGGSRLVYTGDIKLRDPLCGRPTEIVPCDRLIIESTWGLPIFHFLDAEQARERLLSVATRTLAEGDTPVFLGYALGRGQEIAHILCAAGIPTAVHGAIARLVPIYEDAGYQFPGLEAYQREQTAGRALVVVPGFRSVLQATGKGFRFILVSGAAALANARARSGVEELIPWSDHGDFDELLALVEGSGAQRIDVIHGYAEAFAAILRQRGHHAVAPREGLLPVETTDLAEVGREAPEAGPPAGAEASVPTTSATTAVRSSDTTAARSSATAAARSSATTAARSSDTAAARSSDTGPRAASPLPAAAIPPPTFPAATLDAFGTVARAVASTPRRLRKVGLVAEHLRSLPDDDLGLAALFLTGRAFPRHDPRKLSLGHATLRDAALSVTGWDLETVRLCLREVGDTAEGISLLLHGHGGDGLWPLEEAAADYTALGEARKTSDKRALLETRFRHKRPEAVEWFLKVITGELRIGLQEKMVEEAIARAFDVSLSSVRQANNRSGDISLVALSARHGELETIEATLFHPMDFMLAKPLESIDTLDDATQWILEDKFDGIRAQAHVEEGRVALFSRGLEELTGTFPELVEAFASLPGSTVIDGEILGWQEGRALPFTFFQQRLARKKVSAELRSQIPVAFVAWDLLYSNGRMLIDEPLELRRQMLEVLLAEVRPPLLLADIWEPRSLDEVDDIFHQARSRANEGLMAKRRGSVYEPGRRSGSWFKLKRPFGTLDVVVTAAEQGHGRRATVLSDYTFAVKDGERFVNVGKAYSGLTDEEIRTLTRHFRKNALQRFGRVVLVEPGVVLEVAFDGVQKSSRHKAGYSLRFPRILRWRHDKGPGDVDSLDTVRSLYDRSLQIHEDAARPGSSDTPTGEDPTTPTDIPP